jgi:thioredoxin-related protein
MTSRRAAISNALFLVALCAYSLSATAQNTSKNTSKTLLLPWPADMRQAAIAANARGEPMVLMVSLPGCPWCELLRRNYLGPMQSEGVASFEFMIHERSRHLLDFKTKRTTPEALSAAYKVTMTPTVLFLGRDGQEIAPRIEGVASADFIGAILDERLATARERIKAMR